MKDLIKKLAFSRIQILRVVPIVILLSAILPFVFDYTLSWADYNIVLNNPGIDNNYATKQYWDEHYGSHDTLYVNSFTPGQTIGASDKTTDIFINKDIELIAPDSNTKPSPGLVIKGNVNIYFEQKEGSDEFPTLTIKGGNAGLKTGAGAGILLTSGNNLHVKGRGSFNVTGGTMNPIKDSDYTEPTAGKDGDYKEHNLVAQVITGAGGRGSNGYGGSAAAIGSNGASGGNYGSGGSALDYWDWGVLSEHQSGNNGSEGGNGGKSDNAGNLFVSGNINTSFVSGWSTLRSYAPLGCGTCKIVSGMTGTLYSGGGGSGAFGGIGFPGPATGVGSGGAGGGGGGGGGSGHIEVTHSWDSELDLQGVGGGGSPGGTFFAGTDRRKTIGLTGTTGKGYKKWSEDGQWIYASDAAVLHQQIGQPGGRGCSLDDYKGSGSGGKGGNSGLSGSAGYYCSTMFNESALSDGEADYARGKSSSMTRCFPLEDCLVTATHSLVDWCTTFLLDEENPESVSSLFTIEYLPRGIELSGDKEFVPEGLTYDTGKEQTIKISPRYDINNKPILTEPDMTTPATPVETKVWLVSKGVVDVESPSTIIKKYDDQPVNLLEHCQFYFNGQNVTEDAQDQTIVCDWYDISGGDYIHLDSAPTKTGTYEAVWTVKGTKYIGAVFTTTRVQIQYQDLHIKANSFTKAFSEPDPKFTVEITGLLEGDELVEGQDYTLERDEGEAQDSYNIYVKLNDESPAYDNYIPTTENGLLVIAEGRAFVKIKTVTFDYGHMYSEHDLEIEEAYSLDAEGHRLEDLDMIEGTDFGWVCQPGKDVNPQGYPINIELGYGKWWSKAHKYQFTIEQGFYIVQPCSEKVEFYSLMDVYEKMYGDPEPPEILVEFDQKYPDEELQRDKDFRVSEIDWSNIGEGTFTIEIIKDGPVAKNYANLVCADEFYKYRVFQRTTWVYIDEIFTPYGVDAPVTINVTNLAEGDQFVEGVDYRIKWLDPKDKNVGSYSIIWEFLDGPTISKYNIRNQDPQTYHIVPAKASITALDDSKTYGQSDPELSGSISPLQYGESFTPGQDYILERQSGEEVGEYSTIPKILETSITKNYDIECIWGSFKINPFTDFGHVIFSDIDDQEYRGFSIHPDFTVSYKFSDTDTKVFNVGADYEVVLTNNIDVGTANIKIIGKSSCIGEANTTFKIKRKPAKFHCDSITTVYGKADQQLSFYSEDMVYGEQLTPQEYIIKREEGSEVGEYEITASVKTDGPIAKNYSFTVIPGKYKITKFTDFANTIVEPVSSKVYTGYDICPTPSLSYKFSDTDTKVFEAGKDFDYSYSNNKNVGLATIMITGKDNCEGSTSINFNITAKEASVECDDIEATYGEAEKDLTITTKGLAETDALVKDQDYTIARLPGTDVGTYTITASIIPTGPVAKNYSFTSCSSAIYTINKFSDFDNVDFSSIGKNTYSGHEICPTPSVSYKFSESNVKVFEAGKDFEYSYKDNINAGEGSVIITGINNCEGTGSTSFTISPKDASITCNNAFATYGQADKELTILVTGLIPGEALVKGVDYTIDREAGTDAGTYEITATALASGTVAKNYSFIITPGIYTIFKFSDFENVDVASIDPIQYTGQEICPDFYVTYNFDHNLMLTNANSVNENNDMAHFVKDKDYKITYKDNINPGIATAILEGINNCQGTKQVTFEIVASPEPPVNPPDSPESALAKTLDCIPNIAVILLVIATIVSLCIFLPRLKKYTIFKK